MACSGVAVRWADAPRVRATIADPRAATSIHSRLCLGEVVVGLAVLR
jgi:hypothetical protein